MLTHLFALNIDRNKRHSIQTHQTKTFQTERKTVALEYTVALEHDMYIPVREVIQRKMQIEVRCIRQYVKTVH